MIYLFIEPVDVWLFRDGRPFDAGSDHRAESIFPPFPSVIQGVLRSHHLAVHGIDLRDQDAIARAVGTATDFGPFRMRGPFLARRKDKEITRYFPVPADATREGDQVRSLTPEPCPSGIRCSAPTPWLLCQADEPKKGEVGAWLGEQHLHDYLSGKAVSTVRSDDLFCAETRFGIGLDDATRTAREGALYEVAFTRPHADVGLAVEVDGLDGWPDSGFLRMGGEGRGGRFQPITPQSWPTIPDPLPSRFKVYFATPTFFNEGWCPGDWGRFFSGEVRLLAAAVNRYLSQGGFDWATNHHKAARRYVPAGSVYYFECHGNARLRPKLAQQAITDAGAEIGFGQVIIKEW